MQLCGSDNYVILTNTGQSLGQCIWSIICKGLCTQTVCFLFHLHAMASANMSIARTFTGQRLAVRPVQATKVAHDPHNWPLAVTPSPAATPPPSPVIVLCMQVWMYWDMHGIEAHMCSSSCRLHRLGFPGVHRL